MIQVSTKIPLIDNSGARTAEIIRLSGGNKRIMYDLLSNLAVVSIKKIKNKQGKIKKGQVHKLRIVRKKGRISRKDGSSLNFDNRGGILLNDQLNPIASRLWGPLTRELKSKYSKITNMAKKLL
jgi:large subunit ribosomal protein L14